MKTIVAAFLLPVFCSVACAEDNAKHEAPAATGSPGSAALNSVVEPGKYKPLTFWYRLKLGSAYYADPTSAQNVDLAYQYDLSNFAKEDSYDTVLNLVKNGDVTLAIVSGHDLDVDPAAAASASYELNTPEKFKSAVNSGKIKLLSSDHVLLGHVASGTFVKAPAQ